MTPLQWLEELLFLWRKKLGTVVSIAIQVEQELKIRDSIQCRAVQLQEVLEPHLEHALLTLQALDSRWVGGRVGRVLRHAAAYVPQSILRQLPESCLALTGTGAEASEHLLAATPAPTVSSPSPSPSNKENKPRASVTVSAQSISAQATLVNAPTAQAWSAVKRVVPSQTPLKATWTAAVPGESEVF